MQFRHRGHIDQHNGEFGLGMHEEAIQHEAGLAHEKVDVDVGVGLVEYFDRHQH